jgi:hypothetical protein
VDGRQLLQRCWWEIRFQAALDHRLARYGGEGDSIGAFAFLWVHDFDLVGRVRWGAFLPHLGGYPSLVKFQLNHGFILFLSHVVLISVGIMIAPAFHRLLHYLHLERKSDNKEV